MSNLIDRLRNDPVELAFGIATVVGIIAFVVLFFYDQEEILGMSRVFLMALAILWSFGARVGWWVVRAFRQFM